MKRMQIGQTGTGYVVLDNLAKLVKDRLLE